MGSSVALVPHHLTGSTLQKKPAVPDNASSKSAGVVWRRGWSRTHASPFDAPTGVRNLASTSARDLAPTAEPHRTDPR